MKENIGELGESDFKKLCSSIGISANKSDVDVTGWDYFVEFNLDLNSNYSVEPLDLMKAPLECKVQVKATKGDRKSCQIELSNLVRLVKTPLPAFVCFIKYEESSILPKAIYLVHIGEEMISKVLKRLREITVGNAKNKQLNKNTISVGYVNEDRLTEISGQCMKAIIDKYIPTTLENYTKWKQKVIDEVGYENGNTKINVQLSEEDLDSLITQKQTGLANINFESFQVFDERFGIPFLRSSIKRGEGKLTFLPNRSSNRQICFSTLNRRFYFSMQTFFPPFEVLTGSRTVFLLKHPLFEFLINLKTSETQLQIMLGSDLKFILSELLDFADLFLLIIQENKKVQVSFEGKHLFSIDLPSASDFKRSQVISFCETIKSLNELIYKYNFTKLEAFRLSEIHEASHAIKLVERNLLKEPKGIEISLSLSDSQKNYPEIISLVTFLLLRVGSKIFGFLVLFKGSLTNRNATTSLSIEEVIINEAICEEVSKFPNDQLLKKLNDVEDTLAKQNEDFIFLGVDSKFILIN